jgi:hypothetical protein
MFRLTRVIVRLRSEPFGFRGIITYSFLFWRLLVGVKWWLALHWYQRTFKNMYQEMLLGKPFNISVSRKFHIRHTFRLTRFCWWSFTLAVLVVFCTFIRPAQRLPSEGATQIFLPVRIDNIMENAPHLTRKIVSYFIYLFINLFIYIFLFLSRYTRLAI